MRAAATGTLVNTATVAAPGGVTDPNPGNNSATDTDTITAVAASAIPSLSEWALWLMAGLMLLAALRGRRPVR